MPLPEEESQLAVLSPRTKPDCDELLHDIRYALNRANNIQIWARLEFCHRARYCDWVDHDPWSCRKTGPKAEPWKGAADLEIRLVDQIIKENIDISVIASKRAQPHVLPSDLEADDQDRMNKAELWGGVLEHYREKDEESMARAISQLAGIGNEYGHGIMFVGWKEEKRLVKKTMGADVVNQLLAITFMQPEEEVAEQIQMFDKDISESEARRVADQLTPNESCDYQVSITVKAAPDWRAKTPGLDIFYPPETQDIQRAQFIVETEWYSDVEMRGNVETWRQWNKKNVNQVIEKTKAGRAAFFAGISTGITSASLFTWQLTSGMVGIPIGVADMTGEQQMRQWQIITVRYKATDPKSGVPVLYETVFHPDLPDAPLSHKWSVDEHAQYPYVQYIREMSAPTLWASRGIGELSFSEQEEIRAQANFCFDNAAIIIKPPYEASPRSRVASDGLRPGMRVDAISGVANSVKPLEVGGDPSPSIEVQKMALARAMNYHKLGMSEDMDPVAKQVAQQNIVNGFLLSLKKAYQMTFAVIQQFAPDQIRYSCLHGLPVDVRVSREEILGNFSIYLSFNSADLDMASVESRLKVFSDLIVPLDREGLLNMYPMLQLGLDVIFPTFGRQFIKSPQTAQQDEMAIAEKNLMRNLNGMEAEYQEKGGDPALQMQHTQALLQQPAMDEKGQPIMDPQTGRPMPGRAAQLYQSDPAVSTLVNRNLMNLGFRIQQNQNSDTGKLGVKPFQGNQVPA